MIEMRQLETLRAVAAAGSFAGAATELLITPSAVSQQMGALEKLVGSSLFERSTRGVRLTDAGRLLLAAADDIHGTLHRSRRSIGDLRAERRPTATIASFSSAGERLLAPALAALADRYGQPVEVTVLEAEPADAVASVRDGRADMAITFRFGSETLPDGGLDERHLLDDVLRLVVPATGPLGRRRRVGWSDLGDSAWICGWGGTGEAFDRLAAAEGIEPRIACRSSDYGFMQALVGAGVGIALVPEMALVERPDTAVIDLSPTATRHVSLHVAPRMSEDHPVRTLEALLSSEPAT